MKTITIKGTALSPGLDAPKMLKICGLVSSADRNWGCGTCSKDNQEQKIHIRNVVKLVPQVLGNETERGVLCCPNLVPAVVLNWKVVLINSFGR